jgi:hypothetical protein
MEVSWNWAVGGGVIFKSNLAALLAEIIETAGKADEPLRDPAIHPVVGLKKLLLMAALAPGNVCVARDLVLAPSDIPINVTLLVHDSVRLPLPDPCRLGPVCAPQFSQFALDGITGPTARIRWDSSLIGRPDRFTVGATISSWDGGLAFTLTNLTATTASVTIFHDLERKPVWLFASSNYGAAPHNIQFQSWTLKAGYQVDFGDGTKTFLPQCPLRVGHCIKPVTVSHAYLSPGHVTATLFDPAGKSADHWPITIIAAAPATK